MNVVCDCLNSELRDLNPQPLAPETNALLLRQARNNNSNKKKNIARLYLNEVTCSASSVEYIVLGEWSRGMILA